MFERYRIGGSRIFRNLTGNSSTIAVCFGRLRVVKQLFWMAIAGSTLFAADRVADEARMNQIQVLGTHNSYKRAIDPSLLSILRESMG